MWIEQGKMEKKKKSKRRRKGRKTGEESGMREEWGDGWRMENKDRARRAERTEEGGGGGGKREGAPHHPASHDRSRSLPDWIFNGKQIRNMIQFTQLAVSISPLLLLVSRNGATQSLS